MRAGLSSLHCAAWSGRALPFGSSLALVGATVMRRSVVVSVLVVLTAAACGHRRDTAPQATESEPPVSQNAEDLLRSVGAAADPFAFKVLSVEHIQHTWGPQVNIELETTLDDAKKATEQDLRTLWDRIKPALSDRRVFLRVTTDVPGAMPWGVVTRIFDDGKPQESLQVLAMGLDAVPYCFVEKIDRTKDGQRMMLVTLPMVNRIHADLTRRGFKLKERAEDFYSTELKEAGSIRNLSVTITPESIKIMAFRRPDTDLMDVADVVFGQLGMADQLRGKLNTVVGGPEYMRATDDAATWDWRFGHTSVTFVHRENSMDSITAYYVK
jgi:hypothetical protein